MLRYAMRHSIACHNALRPKVHDFVVSRCDWIYLSIVAVPLAKAIALAAASSKESVMSLAWNEIKNQSREVPSAYQKHQA